MSEAITYERLVSDRDLFLADVRSRATLADVVVVDPSAGEHTAESSLQEDGRMVLTVDATTHEEMWT